MDHAAYRHLKLTREGRVTTLTFNRPEVKNAINEALHHEIYHALTALDLDDACDVIVLAGAGDCFCGGGDLQWVLSMNGDPVASAAGIRMDRKLQNALLDLEKPIIAKVRGSAIGLGCSLSLYCDFVYATPDAVFADPHVSIGLVAGDGGAVMWPLLVGYARARRYLLTGDRIRGKEAAEMGLITEAIPEDKLDEVVEAMARRLASGAPYAIKYTKAAINAGLKVIAAAIIDRAAAFENVTMMTKDNRIACEAFLAKKKPTFAGS